MGPLHGVLRHLKVYLVQHDILWPRGGGSVCHVAKYEMLLTYLVFVKREAKLY